MAKSIKPQHESVQKTLDFVIAHLEEIISSEDNLLSKSSFTKLIVAREKLKSLQGLKTETIEAGLFEVVETVFEPKPPKKKLSDKLNIVLMFGKAGNLLWGLVKAVVEYFKSG